MRHPVATALAVLVLATAVRADQPAATPPTTAPAAPVAVAQSTEVRGEVPDLGGRWYAVMRLGVKADQPNALVSRIFEVTAPGGVPEVRDRLVTSPPAIAQQEKAVAWKPTPDDLREIAASWETLPPESRSLVALKTELLDAAHFDDPLKAEPLTKDAPWVLRQTSEYLPGSGRPTREVLFLAPTEKTADGWRGNAATIIVAMAPFPIPISLFGTFEMHRLEEPRKGVVARFFDLFSGCGRAR